MKNEERLDKLLAVSGYFSRSEARTVIQSGLTTVNGAVVRDPGAKTGRDAAITVRGERIDCAQFVYLMLHKPAGYVSGAAAERDLPPVTELLPEHLRRRGVFCVGRLDVDVTGLLLLTDDGAWAHRITTPRTEISKRYAVLADGPLGPDDVDALAAGVTLKNGTAYRPAGLVIDGTDPARAVVTVTEGKYHEVKNLLAVRGRKVLAMRRLSIGSLRLDDDLSPGSYRHLTEEERKLPFI